MEHSMTYRIIAFHQTKSGDFSIGLSETETKAFIHYDIDQDFELVRIIISHITRWGSLLRDEILFEHRFSLTNEFAPVFPLDDLLEAEDGAAAFPDFFRDKLKDMKNRHTEYLEKLLSNFDTVYETGLKNVKKHGLDEEYLKTTVTSLISYYNRASRTSNQRFFSLANKMPVDDAHVTDEEMAQSAFGKSLTCGI